MAKRLWDSLPKNSFCLDGILMEKQKQPLMEGTDAFPSWNSPTNGFCSMPNLELLFIYKRMKRIRSIFNFLESLKIKNNALSSRF